MCVGNASASEAGKVCPDQEVLITPPPQTLLCQPLLEVFLDFFFFFEKPADQHGQVCGLFQVARNKEKPSNRHFCCNLSL